MCQIAILSIFIVETTTMLRAIKYELDPTREQRERYLNAARNIEREGLSLCGLNVGGCSERAPRTIRTPRINSWE